MKHLDFDEVERSLYGVATNLNIQPTNATSPKLMRHSPSHNYSLLGTPSGVEMTVNATQDSIESDYHLKVNMFNKN